MQLVPGACTAYDMLNILHSLGRPALRRCLHVLFAPIHVSACRQRFSPTLVLRLGKPLTKVHSPSPSCVAVLPCNSCSVSRRNERAPCSNTIRVSETACTVFPPPRSPDVANASHRANMSATTRHHSSRISPDSNTRNTIKMNYSSAIEWTVRIAFCACCLRT
ncbi:hypothetical protein PLICRDRAFT_393223 [Plicaturopsis crispa FD-325 SS-3]|nr:hypothetical protein PLICRDRAFT_393223 [Plicaturopsis crispa FD-325 SS-3]